MRGAPQRKSARHERARPSARHFRSLSCLSLTIRTHERRVRAPSLSPARRPATPSPPQPTPGYPGPGNHGTVTIASVRLCAQPPCSICRPQSRRRRTPAATARLPRPLAMPRPPCSCPRPSPARSPPQRRGLCMLLHPTRRRQAGEWAPEGWRGRSPTEMRARGMHLALPLAPAPGPPGLVTLSHPLLASLSTPTAHSATRPPPPPPPLPLPLSRSR